MVLGCRLAVTSFLPVAGCFCFGSFSFCVLGARRLFCRCCFCRWFLFFCVAGLLRVVDFAGFLLLLGFGLWRLLFAGRVAVVGVCRLLLLCWVCCFSGLSRLAGFCVFRTSTFSPLLPYFCVVRRLRLLAFCYLLPAPVCFLPPVFWRSLPC